MPRLGDTVAILARRKTGVTGNSVSVGAAKLLELQDTFGPNPGRLQMYSYVPRDLAANAPVVVCLHGCGQSAEEYAIGAGWLILADRLGFAVLAPQQSASNNPNKCFNWFSDGDVTKGEGEAASIASMIAWIVKHKYVDPNRVFVTGLSAGGAMTMVMLASYPELFAGGAVIAGLPFGVAHDMMQAMMVMSLSSHRTVAQLGKLVPHDERQVYPKLSVWHGSADHVVAPANGDAIAEQWASAHGLASHPDETVIVGKRTRSLWREPNDGRVVVELNRLEGLGHGVPLSTTGADGVGQTGPFMLEAGVSSSEEIAAFWGLQPETPNQPSVTADAERSGMDAVAKRRTSREPVAAASQGKVANQVLATLNQRVPSKVYDVVADALRRAGL